MKHGKRLFPTEIIRSFFFYLFRCYIFVRKNNNYQWKSFQKLWRLSDTRKDTLKRERPFFHEIAWSPTWKSLPCCNVLNFFHGTSDLRARLYFQRKDFRSKNSFHGTSVSFLSNLIFEWGKNEKIGGHGRKLKFMYVPVFPFCLCFEMWKTGYCPRHEKISMVV